MSKAKIAAAVVLASAASYGTIQLGEKESAPIYAAVGDRAEGWLQNRWHETRAFVARHPAISGMLAGCAAGSTVFPGVGTLAGCAAGAGIGATVGGDERASRAEQVKP